MINKKYLLTVILLTVLISSGTTYILTKNQNRPVNETRILKDSIVSLESKILVYKEVINLTNDYFSGKKISDSNLTEKYSDSLIATTIHNFKLYQNERQKEPAKVRPKVIRDTLVQIEKDSEAEQELAQIKSELLLTQEKINNPVKSKEILTLVSSKGIKIQYVGEVQNGMANGYGEGIFGTGSIYKGYWKDNLRHGIGVFSWEDKEFYEGSFVNGKREGYGEYHWKNGEVYKGYWKNDMRHGKGSLYKKNGKLKKEGIWENDELK